MISLENLCEKKGETHQCQVVNANYDRVMFALARFLQEERFTEVCRCRGCVSNIAATALNYLPPHYYYYAETDKESETGSPWVMVESAVVEAIETVRKNPKHHATG